jgi:hypothetical protein
MRVAPSPFPLLPEPLTVEGDVAIYADFHAPFHDENWVNQLTELALKLGVRKAVVAGDAIDFSAFSHYGRAHCLEADMELNAVKQVLDSLVNSFDDVAYIQGNHELRFSRYVGYMLDATQLIEKWVANPKVRITRLHWCNVISGGVLWRIEHPRNTSVNAGVVPAKLCAKYHANVVGAHGHVWGITKDVSGDYFAVDSGICADPKRIEFGYVEHATRPEQMQGACLLVGGVPILLCPQNVGWYAKMRPSGA